MGDMWYCRPAARNWTGPAAPSGAHAFHRSLPGYAPTPLVSVPAIAAELGVGRVLGKDGSTRLGLPAFKVLGASWACRQVLAQHPGAMLVTATDGNHGRAVARMAARFGVEATVFVPAVMHRETAARIADEGAKVVWVDGAYDAAVRRAAAYAGDQPGRALVQDTAWDGYEQVPAWIVEGVTGLNCGTVSGTAWPILRAGCDAAVAVGDDDALRAVQDLDRLGVCSGPSGAATLAGVRAALTDPQRRAALGRGADAVVVLLSTEGQIR